MAKRQETFKKSGVVEQVVRSGKAFLLAGDENWYSVFKASQAEGVAVGASVSFEYTTNPAGGKIFYNVQGDVRIDSEAPKTTTSAGTSVNTRDVHMTRGGALKVAAPVVMQWYGENPPPELEAVAEDIITLSRLLEAYVHGE